MKKGRPLAPKGGNDKVWTPDDLAFRIVDHFQPSGLILEPCKGEGSFMRAFSRNGINDAIWCEIDKGVDFLEFNDKVDWIITNPPWSQFRKFLKKSMEVSNNIVFLALLNAWFMKARVRDMQENGFGLVEVLMVDTPPKPWPQTGFQLAAVHALKGYTGEVKFTF